MLMRFQSSRPDLSRGDLRRSNLVALAVFISLAAHGESNLTPEEQDEMRTLDAVQVTAARRSELASEVPQSVTVLDKQALQKISGQTNADLLRGEVGTFVQQTTPGQAVIIVRGLKGSEILHLVDGFRLNNGFFRNAPNQYPALVDPLMIEQLEVVRGPSSVLYGSDAMGGVVHMLSARPSYTDSGWNAQGALKTRFASADNSSISRSEVRLSSPQLYLQAGVTYQDVNQLHVGGDDVLPFTSFTSRFADTKMGWRPSEGHELIFNAQFSRQPKTPRFDELVPGFGQTRPTSSEFLFKPQERRFAQLSYRWEADQFLFDDLKLGLGRQDIIDDRLNRDFASLNRDIEDNRSELKGYTAQFEKSLGAHFLTYGLEHYDDVIRSARQRVNVNTQVVSARPSRYPDGSTMQSLGFYLSNDWNINDRLDVLAGIRHSRFDIELPAANGSLGVRLQPNKTTGHLGVNFDLRPGVSLVANYGRGFRAPNIFDLGTFGSRPGNRFNIPNPNLKPETVDTIDVGLKFNQELWSGELIAYQSRYDDKITGVDTGTRNSANQLIVQNLNVTRLDINGIEAGVRYQNGPWSAAATATYTRGEEKLANLIYDADRIPPLFGKWSLDYQFSEQIGVSAYSFYADQQDRLSPRDVTDPRINPDGTAGFATANVALNWQAADSLFLRLAAENLADKRYREHGTGLDEAGRSINLSVDWNWD